MDPSVLQGTHLSRPFPQSTSELENGFPLIDAEIVRISPEGTGLQKTGELDKPTSHSIQPDLDKMPQSIKTDKEQNRNPHYNTVVPHLENSARFPINIMKNLFKAHQVQELDQAQKACKNAESLPAGPVKRKSRDFSGRGDHSQKHLLARSFVIALHCFLTIWVTSYLQKLVFANSILILSLDGFLFFIHTSVQDRRAYSAYRQHLTI